MISLWSVGLENPRKAPSRQGIFQRRCVYPVVRNRGFRCGIPSRISRRFPASRPRILLWRRHRSTRPERHFSDRTLSPLRLNRISPGKPLPKRRFWQIFGKRFIFNELTEILPPKRALLQPQKELLQPQKELPQPRKEFLQLRKELLQPQKEVLQPRKVLLLRQKESFRDERREPPHRSGGARKNDQDCGKNRFNFPAP